MSFGLWFLAAAPLMVVNLLVAFVWLNIFFALTKSWRMKNEKARELMSSKYEYFNTVNSARTQQRHWLYREGVAN
jgi:hypothetical protein